MQSSRSPARYPLDTLQYPSSSLSLQSLHQQHQHTMSVSMPQYPQYSSIPSHHPRAMSNSYPVSSPLSSSSSSSFQSPVSDQPYELTYPEATYSSSNHFYATSATTLAPPYNPQSYTLEQPRQDHYDSTPNPQGWTGKQEEHEAHQHQLLEQHQHQYQSNTAQTYITELYADTAPCNHRSLAIYPIATTAPQPTFYLESERWEDYDSPVYVDADSPVHAKFSDVHSHSSSLALAHAQVHAQPTVIRVKQEELTINTKFDDYCEPPTPASPYTVSAASHNSDGYSPDPQGYVYSAPSTYSGHANSHQEQYVQPVEYSPNECLQASSPERQYAPSPGQEVGCDPRYVSGDPGEEVYSDTTQADDGYEEASDSDKEPEQSQGRETDEDDYERDAEGEEDDGEMKLLEDVDAHFEYEYDDDGDSEYVVRRSRSSADLGGERRSLPRRSSARSMSRYSPYAYADGSCPSDAYLASNTRPRRTSSDTSSSSSSSFHPVSSSFYEPNISARSPVRRRPRPTTSLPIPIPVPNLTKKSRGRRVPTISSHDFLDVRRGGGFKGARLYTCKVADCGKCFARGEHLKRHVRSIHTNEKPHKCPFPGCGKDFSRHDNLGQHMKVHDPKEHR